MRSGRIVRLNGEPFTIVGVLPPDFGFVNPDIQLVRPAAFTAREKSDDRATATTGSRWAA